MSIVLERLTKRYDGYPVVNNVSLEVRDGEFFVLLGSSGSGKTTILNLIAGLTGLDQGRILLQGREVTGLPTQQRRVGFVFQNYALFQYMTVAENVEFGLSIRKVAGAERRRRRDELLELVGLAGLGDRMPRQLSGGQQQRIALARALAHEPTVLLLDEPLGALDAKIRVELRRTLRAIQRQLGIATILVTHDQEEAFDLADRIGVMSFGRLVEVGTPEELYQSPQTEFVASFLGTANLLVGSASPGGIQVGPLRFPALAGPLRLAQEQRVQVLFRPEDVALGASQEELDCPYLGQGEVEEISFAGSFERLRLRLPPISGVRPIAPPVAFGNNTILVEATRPPDQANRFPLETGQSAWVGVRRIHSLAHPGLRFLVVTDGSLRAQSVLSLGGQIARLAHARVTLLGCGQDEGVLQAHLEEARKQLGSGLASLEIQTSPEPVIRAITQAVERQPYDLVLLGFHHREDIALAEQVLQSGDHHLLLVPAPQNLLARALICVAYGEPGKEDVLFAGRLVRHLGAEATLVSVVPGIARDLDLQARAERFLASGVKSLSVLGVPATTKVRSGTIAAEICDEVKTGEYDLVVLGAPLPNHSGQIALSGAIGQILTTLTDRSILIVRSHTMGAKVFPLSAGEHSHAYEEIRR
jgi:sulfate transport system ATP-binding protein